jgi:hypothetical protein
MDIPTSCSAVGVLYQLAPHHRELRSGGPVRPRATGPPLPTRHKETEESSVYSSCDGPRKFRPSHQTQLPPLLNLTSLETTSPAQDLLTDRLAAERATAWNGSSPTSHIEDLPEPTQFLLQFADAPQLVDDPDPIKDDPFSFLMNILHLPNSPIYSQSGHVNIHIPPNTSHTTILHPPNSQHNHNTPLVTCHVRGTSWAATYLTTILIHSQQSLSHPCINVEGAIPLS